MRDSELLKEARQIIADVMGDLVRNADYCKCADFLDKCDKVKKDGKG